MKTREQTIFDMCMTMNHSFGFVADDPGQFGALSPAARRALHDNMSQLYEHHIAPLVARIEQLESALAGNGNEAP